MVQIGLKLFQIGLNAKDLFEPKYQLLTKKRESVGLNHLTYSKTFIEYSNDIDGIYENIDDYNSKKRGKY